MHASGDAASQWGDSGPRWGAAGLPHPSGDYPPLRIEKRLYAQILEHLVDELPNEGCGLIAFDYDRAVKVYRGTNILRSPRRYRMADTEVLRAIEEIDANGWWLGAIYHSHPHSDPTPSTTDIRESNWPDALMLIVSLQNAEPEARVYRLLRGAAQEVPLECYSEWSALRRLTSAGQRAASAWAHLTQWLRRPSAPASALRPLGGPLAATSGSEQVARLDPRARAGEAERCGFAAPASAERCAVIGILGGMGPAATADLYRKIVEATPAGRDQEHIPVVIHADPRVPDRSEALLNGGPDPTPWLVEGAQALERMGATFIVIPCNTAHAFLARVQPHIDRPILSMIDATVDTIRDKHPSANIIGLLATSGTLASGVYQRTLEARGLVAIAPDEDLQARCVMPAIAAVKAGRADEEATALMREAAEQLRARGADVLVAGCTEIPLILRAEHVTIPLVDATDALARAAVSTAFYLNGAARAGRPEWETSPTGWSVNAART